MKLDELARTSATAARTAVSRLDPPAIGEHPHRLRGPIIAGAALSTAVVGGLVVVGQNGTGPSADEPVPTVPATVVVPRLGLDLTADDRWQPVFATDGSDDNDGNDFPKARFDYYGDAASATPYADDDLLVLWTTDGDGEPPDGEPVVVRGVDGTIASGEQLGVGADTVTLSWLEPDGTSVMLASRHADGDRLVSIADTMVIDAPTGVVRLADEAGLDLVGSDTATPFMAPRGDADASLVAYQAQGDADLSLVLTARGGDLARTVRATEWWIGTPTEVVMDGGPAYEFDLTDLFDGSGDGSTGRILEWSPSAGVVAQLIVSGPAVDLDVTALAEAVVELDDDQWAALLRSEAAPDPDTASFDRLFGEGAGEIEGSRYGWAFGEQDGQLCFDVSTGGGGSGSCQEMPTTLQGEVASGVDHGVTDEFGYWLIAADPSVDDVVDTTGIYDVERFDVEPFAWFVATGPGSQTPSFDVLDDGAVVATVEGGVAADEQVEPATDGPAVLRPDPTLADNPSAVELGVADMAVVTTGSADGLTFWLGLVDDRICLVTDGAAISAGCVGIDDVGVFPPVQVDGEERVFVLLRDLPACVSGTAFDGADIGGSSSIGTGDHTYELAWGRGPVSTWNVRLTDDNGREWTVDLPADGSAELPAGLCD